MADGYVTIGFRADTKQLERDKARIERELKKYDEQIEDLTDIKIHAEIDEASYRKIEKDIERVKNRLQELRKDRRIYEYDPREMRAIKPNFSIEKNALLISKLEKAQADLQQKLESEKKTRQENLSVIEKTSKKISEVERKQERSKKRLEDINSHLKKAGRSSDSDGAEGGGLAGLLSGGLGKVGLVVSLVSVGLSGIINQVGKWGMAMLGIRSAYSFIRTAMSTISGYNDKIRVDVAYIRFAIASTLQPVVEYLVSMAMKLLSLIGAVIKTLTGYNIFANATMNNFNKAQGNIDKANKSAKELRKTLASFDELNVLQDNSSDSGGGGTDLDIPSIDLSTTDLFKNWNLEDLVKKGKEMAEKIAKGINDFFTKTNWEDLGKKISDFIIGAIDVAILFFETVDWDKIGRSIGRFLMSIDWGTIFKKLAELILRYAIPAGLKVINGVLDEVNKWLETPGNQKKLEEGFLNFFGAVIKGIGSINVELWKLGFNLFKALTLGLFGLGQSDGSGGGKSFDDTTEAENKGKKLGASIIGGLGEGITKNRPSLFKTIKSLWDGIDENSKTGLGTLKKSLKEGKLPEWIQTNIVDKVKTKVEGFANSVGRTIATILQNAINGVISIIEARMNDAIRLINKVLNLLKNLPIVGGGIGNVSEIKLPRVKLAKGGIVNLPGPGVPIGGATVGENKQEGVIPLTDSQQMALLGEAIGKYITINASITNTMNGRVISRELQRINNEDDFAYNRG